ncbi:MAG: M15 family metallopeptidase [Bacilli bacterium]
MKKKIRTKRLLLVIGIILLIAGFFIVKGTSLYKNCMINRQLSKLNYSDKAIVVIKEKDMTDYILDNKLYSEVIDEAFANNDFNINCISVYKEVQYDDKAVSNINTLYRTGYRDSEILNIFKYLSKDEITILTNKDYIEDIARYIINDNFNINNLERYLSYKETSKLSYDEVIAIVNVGSDIPYYKEIKEIKDSSSILALVNKYNKLPSTYKPSNLQTISKNCSDSTFYLRKEANEAFTNLCSDSKSIGLSILVTSSYRDYNYQLNLYNYYLGIYGLADTDIRSARPGHSEHQTGLAVDIKTPTAKWDDFVDTNEYTWIKNNAHLYGFIIRYPKGKEVITGYKFEPWHLRYVGIETATKIYNENITFDEYYVKYIK